MRYRLSRTTQNLSRAPAVSEPQDQPVAPRTPTVQMIQAQARRTEDAWQAYSTTPSGGLDDDSEKRQALAHYEQQVRNTGQMVHDRAVRLHDIPEAVDYEALHQEHFEEDLAEYNRLAAIQKEYSDRAQEVGYSNTSEEFREEWSRVGKQMEPMRKRLSDGRAKMWEEAQERSRVRSESYGAVMAEVSELGGQVEMYEGTKTAPHLQARAAVQQVADATPTAWIDKSNLVHRATPLYAYPSKGRAHYVSRENDVPIGESEHAMSHAFISDSPDVPPPWEPLKKTETWVRDDEFADAHGFGPAGGVRHEYAWRKKGRKQRKKVTAARLSVSGGDDRERQRVARHEFAHRIESLEPRVATAAQEFRRRRTTREDGTREPLSRIYDEGEKEVGYRDGFVNHYVGKDYGSGPHTEVFSVGSESLWNGSQGGLAGDGPNMKADPEHRNLILGLYASAGESRE